MQATRPVFIREFLNILSYPYPKVYDLLLKYKKTALHYIEIREYVLEGRK